MVHLTPRYVLDAALWIQICDKKTLEVDFSREGIRIHLPTHQDFSSYYSVPRNKLGDIFYDMEKQQLIETKERSGKWTTPKGNQLVADIIEKKYRKQASAILNEKLLKALILRLRSSKPDRLKGKSRNKSDKESSFDNKEISNPLNEKLSKYIFCTSCHEQISTNDRRRKYCDKCRPVKKSRKRNRLHE